MIKYKVFDEKEYTKTQKFSPETDSNPQMHIHTRIINFDSITKVNNF